MCVDKGGVGGGRGGGWGWRGCDAEWWEGCRVLASDWTGARQPITASRGHQQVDMRPLRVTKTPEKSENYLNQHEVLDYNLVSTCCGCRRGQSRDQVAVS